MEFNALKKVQSIYRSNANHRQLKFHYMVKTKPKIWTGKVSPIESQFSDELLFQTLIVSQSISVVWIQNNQWNINNNLLENNKLANTYMYLWALLYVLFHLSLTYTVDIK